MGTITHAKTNAIADWTQAQLDAAIAAGQFAAGTTLAQIVLPSDWNADHTIDLTQATAKTALVDADLMALADSAATFVLKKITWANVKATLKTYLDTLYQAILVSGTNIKTINGSSVLGAGNLAVSSSPTVVSVTPSGTLNDYSPGSFTSLYVAPTAATIITGLLAGTAGQQLTIFNKSTTAIPVVLCDENAGSSAANRFTFTVGINRGHLVLWPGDACVIEYDGTASRWVLVEAVKESESGVRRSFLAQAGSTAVTAVGLPAPTNAGATGVNLASSSYIAEVSRLNVTTTSTINTLGSVRGSSNSVFPGDAAGRGGFLSRARFGFATIPSSVATFMQTMKGTTSPVATSSFSGQFTNLPIVGVGVDNGQTTLRFWKAGTGIAIDTTNDLGANFPFSAGSCYDLSIYMPPNGGAVGWAIWRTDDMTITPKAGYETSGIPTTTDAMNMTHCIANLAGAAYISSFMSFDQWTPN